LNKKKQNRIYVRTIYNCERFHVLSAQNCSWILCRSHRCSCCIQPGIVYVDDYRIKNKKKTTSIITNKFIVDFTLNNYFEVITIYCWLWLQRCAQTYNYDICLAYADIHNFKCGWLVRYNRHTHIFILFIVTKNVYKFLIYARSFATRKCLLWSQEANKTTKD
jgi:hypothetical protein